MSDEVGVPIGSVDMVETILGEKGNGKSTYLVERVMHLQRELGAYVIGHSPGARLPLKLPSGRPTRVEYYPDLKQMERGLRRDTSKIHIVARGPADDIIQYARDMSLRLRKRAWGEHVGLLGKRWTPETQMTGVHCQAIIVVIDEAVSLKGATGNIAKRRDEESQLVKEALFGARHDNIAYFVSIQDPGAFAWTMMSQSTIITCFRLEHDWSQIHLRAAGFTEEQIELVGKLDGGQYIQKVKGVRDFSKAGKVG